MPPATDIENNISKMEIKDQNVKKLDSTLKKLPEYISHRIAVYDRCKASRDALIASQPPQTLKITLPDGRVETADAWKTSPYDIMCRISKGLADNAVIAKVDGVLWDLDRVLEKDCSLQVLQFEGDEVEKGEGRAVFWHSSAHVLGEAMEKCYDGCLCYGPPIEAGFYYDMFMNEGQSFVGDSDFKTVEDVMKGVVKEKQPFERLEMTKDELREMFNYNPFKLRIIDEKISEPTATVYRCGTLIDLCRGPHVRHTGKIKAMTLTKTSSAYWEGKEDKESLSRVYGISFPDTKQMKEWKHLQEEAAKRDHRKIGKDQNLFFFSEMSPGSCCFEPKGAHIFNKLIEYMRDEYWSRGFTEVVSPNIFNSKLWKTSGHWDLYAENMFRFDVEDKEKFGLKPMNCPGHCLIFDHGVKSWKDMPIRYAEFGVLHRNEASGALTGLTRVRRFQQDDAHIFCRPDQVKEEVRSCIDFLQSIYKTFGFTFKLVLSTRPEDKYIGSIEQWDEAEKALEDSLNASGMEWKLNPGDGAFYGPKIDISLRDALKRFHQCGTIQLDFQLPLRFKLGYVDSSGEKATPIIIHRAILGSVERFLAIITESFGGKWPFWLSPNQVMVVPVSPVFDEYALKVKEKIRGARFCADYDSDPSNSMNKKVRNAQLAQYNFIFVVGEKESSSGTVNVRTRDNKVHGEFTLDQVIQNFQTLAANRTKDGDEECSILWSKSDE